VVKAIFLATALLGYTSLWFAIAADTGATPAGDRECVVLAAHSSRVSGVAASPAGVRIVLLALVALLFVFCLRPTFSAEAWTRDTSGRSGLFSNDPSGWCRAGRKALALLSSDPPG